LHRKRESNQTPGRTLQTRRNGAGGSRVTRFGINRRFRSSIGFARVIELVPNVPGMEELIEITMAPKVIKSLSITLVEAVKEIERLIKKLELDKEFLAEQDTGEEEIQIE
jgi:hypothetical protein